jgi:hypothetical protein
MARGTRLVVEDDAAVGGTLVPVGDVPIRAASMRRPMIYLVAPAVHVGAAHAAASGWVRIAARRFVTGEGTDVRLVVRFSEMVPLMGAETPMVKAAGYEEGEGVLVPDNWLRDMERFEEFAKKGNGVWVDG